MPDSNSSRPERTLVAALFVAALIALGVYWMWPLNRRAVVPQAAPGAGNPAGGVVAEGAEGSEEADDADAPTTLPVTATAAPQIPFADVTSALGIDFVQRGGAVGDKMLPESGGAGCALFDYDGDGDLDLLLLSGKSWPWDDPVANEPTSTIALYRNDGATFADVTAEAGLMADFYAQGPAIGDVDGDGDDDLFITAVGQNRFYRNDGGTFVDATADSRLGGKAEDWTTSAGFFDYDRDGDLDLFVCNYLRWTREIDQRAGLRVPGTGLSYAHPSNFDGVHNYLYRNDGGRFTDVSAAAGIQLTDAATGKPLAKSLAVTFVDFDRDGWLDIAVANDTVRHLLYHNQGDGTFHEMGEERGVAFNAAGATTSGMGVDAAWIFNDDRLAIAVSNFAAEMSEFYLQQPGTPVAFADEAVQVGLGGPTRDVLTFGLLMDDFDLDGRVDLVHANGHLEETIHEVMPAQTYEQPAQLFWNAGALGEPNFVELSADRVRDLAKPIVGRALASGDLDGDGDLDMAFTQVGGVPLVVRNEQSLGHNWLRVKLEGPAGNPHGIGAIVELKAGGVTQRRAMMPTRSYLAYSEPVITFGLGDTATIESLMVTWPDGNEQPAPPPAVNQTVTITQQASSFASVANRAKAQLENGQFEAAIETLRLATSLEPESLPMRRNLVRAYLMSNLPAEALAELDLLDAAADESGAGAAYLRGLAELRQTDYAAAAEHMQRAVELDPDEATLRFQWALALLGLNQVDQARAQFEKAVELEPLHGAAQYQLATLARKVGNQDAFGRYMRDYLRIRDLRGASSSTALEACRYTEAEPPELASEAPAEPPAPAVFTPRDSVIGGAEDLNVAALGVTALTDEDRYRIAAVAETGELITAEFDAGGELRQVGRSGVRIGEVGGAAKMLIANALVDANEGGDVRRDIAEIAIVTPQRTWLVRPRGDGEFDDLSQSSGLAAASGVSGEWVDVEHDGDVDLCLAGANGLHIWRNNGDGTFVDATADYGITDAASAATDVAAADFDGGNLGVDLLVATADGVRFYRNESAGKFVLESETTASWPAAERLLVDDFTNDGLPDALLLAADAATLAVTRGDGPERLPLQIGTVDAASTIDVDNDGWLDVVISGAAGSALLHNAAGKLAVAAEPPALSEAAAARKLHDLDADADGDVDLLVVNDDGQLSLASNETPKSGDLLKLTVNSFVGHPSSIGVRVQVRAADHVVTRWTHRELPIEIGMGEHKEADSIQTLWPNGIAKNEIGLRLAGAPVRISVVEFIRTDSCPFLYAQQDGQWRFQNDLLGTAPLNVVLARGVMMPADPDEAVVLGPAEDFAAGGAAATLRITSELREVIYVDQVQLIAVDHPADTTVFSRERVGVPVAGPQFVLGRDPIALKASSSSDGVDRTAALLAPDGDFAPPGRVVPPPVVGFTDPLAIELDFGDLADEGDLLLALTGWFRFGNSSANIASSQRGDLQAIWPRLEARGADGQWHVVEEMVGIPAGNTKTIVCDLGGKLPAGADRLRLTTSFEVRWDHMALYHVVGDAQPRVTVAAPAAADLQWHGFAELRPTHPDRPQTPNLARMTNQPRWLNTVAGWCTRYGDVAPLVSAADARMAIMNSGDGLTFNFPANALPAERPGETRTLAIYTRGWIKAADPNSEPDLTVTPFPGSNAPLDENQPADDWQLQYNTRWTPAAAGPPASLSSVP
jgi:tetratricopeptide (TPR) repeat protein